MGDYRPGEAVQVRPWPASPFWQEAFYVGLYTIHYGQRPWHQVQINADKHIVPINRIRRLVGPARKGPSNG